MNLKKFRNDAFGFTRNCYFQLGILDCPVITNRDSAKTPDEVNRVISTYATSTAIPSRSITPVSATVQYGYHKINMGGDVNYAPWTVTFYGDGMLGLRYLFLKWQDMVTDQGRKTFNTPDIYKSYTSYAAVLNPNSLPVQVYRFYGVWPSDVSGLTVSNSDTSLIQYSVTFTYDFFTINDQDIMAIVNAQETSNINSGVGKEEDRITTANWQNAKLIPNPFTKNRSNSNEIAKSSNIPPLSSGLAGNGGSSAINNSNSAQSSQLDAAVATAASNGIPPGLAQSYINQYNNSSPDQQAKYRATAAKLGYLP